MKNFYLILFSLIITACSPSDEKIPEQYSLRIRFPHGSIEAKINKELAPQTAEHLINLIESNVFDAGIITKKESTIIINPVSNIQSNLTSIKIALEQSSLKQEKAIVGLLKSSLMEEGDSKLFVCFAHCLELDSNFIALGSITKNASTIDQFQNGQKVLSTLLKKIADQ